MMKTIGEMLKDAQASAYKQSKTSQIDGQKVEGNPAISYGILSHAVAEALESHVFCDERRVKKFCDQCGQLLEAPAQGGEHPCGKCGKPTVHDQSEDPGEVENPAAEIEKRRRVYYQDIVYSVCRQLDRMFGRFTAFGGIVCGTIEEPSTAVQDEVNKLAGLIVDLKNVLKRCQDLITGMRAVVDMGAVLGDEGRQPSLDAIAAYKLARARADVLLAELESEAWRCLSPTTTDTTGQPTENTDGAKSS